MKKTWIVLLVLTTLGRGYDGVSAAITQRIIHAGNTPLASDCVVTQTGPMQLTVSTCSWTTTGQAKIVHESKVPNLSNEIAVGNVERMPYSRRVRGWLQDSQGNIIEKSRTRFIPVPVVLNITAGETWVAYLVNGPGVTMAVVLQKRGELRPAGTLDYILFPFVVPVSTTDLSGIDIEVFTVRPDFPPAKGLFEK